MFRIRKQFSGGRISGGGCSQLLNRLWGKVPLSIDLWATIALLIGIGFLIIALVWRRMFTDSELFSQ